MAQEQDLANELDRHKSRVAHDLRGPLQTIMGYAHLLAEECGGPLTPKQREFVGHIQAGAAKVLEILEAPRS